MYTVSEHLNKGFTGYLKGSAGHQVTRMCSEKKKKKECAQVNWG
jgi:hypothetical protein